jgi:O-antigen biosynthesis protein
MGALGGHDGSTRSSPADAPPIYLEAREEFAARFLFGEGIEIGGLHWPLAVPPGVHVRYVDRMTVDELRREYPELADKELTPVDIVDDGELLTTIPDGSQDFVIANHFLEHCEDPIGTIETHLRKVRPGGILFYAVPDKRYTFDFRRPITPLDHMVSDHEEGPERSRREHYQEWAQLVPDDRPSDEDALRMARELEDAAHSIHMHVWTQAEVLQLILYCRQRFGDAFEVEAIARRSIEVVVVLRKRGSLPEPARAPSVAAAAPVKRAPSELPVAEEPVPLSAVPLAALRPMLDAGWPRDARWRRGVIVHGAACTALEQPSNRAVAFRLRLSQGARLTAWVALAFEGRHGSAGVARLSARVRDTNGRETTIWSGVVGGMFGRGAPAWRRVSARLDSAHAREVDLILSATPMRMASPSAGRVLWADPRIEVGSAPARHMPRSSKPARAAPDEPSSSAQLDDRPLISVLTPVHDPDPSFLEETLASIRRQTFGGWEQCLVDDGSADTRVREILRRHAAEDERIRLVRRERAGGISAATNAGLELATGEYVALLDHDDVLADDALEAMAAAIAEHPDADMLYSDEDLIRDDGRVWLYLKPGWSPDLLRSVMYTCHLGVYRRSLALDVGGFRSEFDGSQDYDFVLRLTELTDRIVHVPRVLYHWRIHERSTAGSAVAKPHAYPSARRAIGEHLRRSGLEAEVHFGAERGEYRVVHHVDPSTPSALVLPVPGADRTSLDCLERAAQSWLAAAHTAWELVLVGPTDVVAACAGRLPAAMRPGRLRTVGAPTHAPRAELINRAARATDADHLVLLEAPVEALSRDWLSRLVGFASQPGVGAVGAKTVSADGRVENAGVVLADGWPLSMLYGADASEAGPLGIARAPGNLCAVSGVVATRRETLELLGGLDDELGELTEVDFCLRARERGMRIVSAPDALVRSVRPTPPVNDLAALATFRARWRERLGRDPYLNPGYWGDRGDFVPRPGV